ncbi:deoxyribonuclease tatD [Neurospora crassa OR74A]|uniref:Deoxyribonuclease tatD n=2 Tax=Neurospora crassa TaxID=5141 RepID=F5HBP0_NEUCR|nr:deoxyribonuclease tatD [Neurospora crassa OR74A]EAA27581.3 deoxyribonuclease tatD [Neurospora crassa OR74A]|eukprot:XP_956817.3 deoxyribonuclease tatD [Neurospora crassa OR74A]
MSMRLSVSRPSLHILARPPILSSRNCNITAPLTTMASNSTLAGNGYKPRYIDIGINLADPIFRGHYHGKPRHPDDLAGVVQRAIDVGCTKLIVTGSSFKSSRDALKIAQQFPHHVYTTAGIHPCSSSIFSTSHHMHHDESGSESEQSPAAPETETAADSASTPIPICADPDPDAPQPEDPSLIDHVRTPQLIASLSDLIDSNRSPKGGLIAFGEFGLDYDRLHYCSRTIQLHSFRAQLSLAASLTPQLPLFLHSRAAHRDFVDCLKEAFGPNLERLEKGGVVHSFTGTLEEMQELMDLGLFIGVNGCSFKTDENCAVVKQIRLDRIMLETDGPWCEVRGGHEGWKYLVKYHAREREVREKAEEEARKKKEEEEEAAKALADVSINGNGTEVEVGNGGTPDISGTSTPNNPSGQQQQQPGQKRERRKKQPQPPPQPKKNKNAKKESDVPERFKVVKKEKWEEGAMVKGRNEPCTIERIAIIVAEIKGISVEEVCEAAWRNTVKVFGLEE